MSIYKPSLLDKFKDFVNGIKSNWNAYEDHVAEFGSHVAESSAKHITESGSNENGNFIKFDDGTMICYKSNHILSGYITNRLRTHWTFPAAFISNDIAIMAFIRSRNTSASSYGNWLLDATNISTTEVVPVVYNQEFAEGDTVTIYITAIGRWK